MGNVVDKRRLAPGSILRLASPVLICSGWQVYEKAVINAGYQNISLNLPLAKLLVCENTKNISVNLTSSIIRLIPKRVSIYLADYEILFNPSYSLDIIRLFIEISRYNRLVVKWCGGFDGHTLTYAEPGYEDYAAYKVRDYEITCVY